MYPQHIPNQIPQNSPATSHGSGGNWLSPMGGMYGMPNMISTPFGTTNNFSA